MRLRRAARLLIVPSAVAVVGAGVSVPSAAAAPATSGTPGRYIVVAKTAADYTALKTAAGRAGAKLVREMPQLNTFVVTGSAASRASLTADSHTLGVATDRIRAITTPERNTPKVTAPGLKSAKKVTVASAKRGAAASGGITADPAFSYSGLLWDYQRIGLPQGWRTTAGSPSVTVGVADTGIDFTHADLSANVRGVVDLTKENGQSACQELYGVGDADLAAEYGGPATTDWNGHGSWVGGNIAASLNGTGVNGIAPKVGLVALKIAEWCGYAYDSAIINAFITAGNTKIDVVNVSFGGYVDRSTAEGETVYKQYADAVKYARQRGTTIVASAGNEHTRIGAGGKVLSHGTLTTPGGELLDLYGQYELPAGIPGVVNVAATGNVNIPASANCAPGAIGSPTDTNPTCKPTTDRHQAAGPGKQDQLAYYSNYGPRIDIAAPGGARKFNLPNYDRGGTPGFPVTGADLTNVWENFSTTSNWATEIPCYTFGAGSGFPENQCYSSIQGTSMASPHVAAAVALTASAHKNLRHKPDALTAWVKGHAVPKVNYTKALSATDTSPGDLTGVACTTGYCHLEGARISNREAYGAGLLNVARP